MNASPANPSRRDLEAVCIAAAIIVVSIAVGLRLSVPEEIADYVGNGLMLPAFRYGLLFPLIACGFILSGERTVALVANLAVLASALWFGLQRAEPIVISHEQLAGLIVRYPVLTAAMGVTSGGALLLPIRARQWLVPVVSASCGLCLGLSIILESPGDYYSGWFSSAGGLGGMAVVIASIAVAGSAQRIGSGSWLAVAGRILGSWLIAASLMLAALAIVPKRPLESAPMPTAIPDDVDLMRQP